MSQIVKRGYVPSDSKEFGRKRYRLCIEPDAIYII